MAAALLDKHFRHVRLWGRVRAMERSPSPSLSLQQIADGVEGRVEGDGSVEVSGVASIGAASLHELVFVEDEKHLSRALQSGAGAVIAGEFAAGASGKPLLISRHPKLTFARAARMLRE